MLLCQSSFVLLKLIDESFMVLQIGLQKLIMEKENTTKVSWREKTDEEIVDKC